MSVSFLLSLLRDLNKSIRHNLKTCSISIQHYFSVSAVCLLAVLSFSLSPPSLLLATLSLSLPPSSLHAILSLSLNPLPSPFPPEVTKVNRNRQSTDGEKQCSVTDRHAQSTQMFLPDGHGQTFLLRFGLLSHILNLETGTTKLWSPGQGYRPAYLRKNNNNNNNNNNNERISRALFHVKYAQLR